MVVGEIVFFQSIIYVNQTQYFQKYALQPSALNKQFDITHPLLPQISHSFHYVQFSRFH